MTTTTTTTTTTNQSSFLKEFHIGLSPPNEHHFGELDYVYTVAFPAVQPKQHEISEQKKCSDVQRFQGLDARHAWL